MNLLKLVLLLPYTVPHPKSVIVTSHPITPIRPLGSNVTIICIVELTAAIYDASLTIEVRLSDPVGSLLSGNTSSESDTVYTSRALISMFQRNQSGHYGCMATIRSPSVVKSVSGESSISTGILCVCVCV